MCISYFGQTILSSYYIGFFRYIFIASSNNFFLISLLLSSLILVKTGNIFVINSFVCVFADISVSFRRTRPYMIYLDQYELKIILPNIMSSFSLS